MVTKKIHLAGPEEALQLFGHQDQNLRHLESTYGVQIFGRGHIFSVRGAPGKVEKAIIAIEEMRQNLGRENRAGPAVGGAHEEPGAAGRQGQAGGLGADLHRRRHLRRRGVDVADAHHGMIGAVGDEGTRTAGTYRDTIRALADDNALHRMRRGVHHRAAGGAT